MTEAELLIVAISVVAGYLILVGLSTAVLPITRFASQIGALLMRPFVFNADRVDSHARRRRIEEEIDRELGRSDAWGRQARAEVIQATFQAQRITMLDQKFRSAIRTCVRTHWAIAEGLGAVHMAEAARHPMCGQLRERVIDVSELLSETIETYPLLVDSPELVRLHVGLYRIAPTCIACPYWTATVANAPRLCPPARAIGCDPDSPRREGAIIDAQFVDGA